MKKPCIDRFVGVDGQQLGNVIVRIGHDACGVAGQLDEELTGLEVRLDGSRIISAGRWLGAEQYKA